MVAEPKAKTVRGDFLTRHIARFEEITRELVSGAFGAVRAAGAGWGGSRRRVTAAPPCVSVAIRHAHALTSPAPLLPAAPLQEAMKPVPQAPAPASATPAVPAH